MMILGEIHEDIEGLLRELHECQTRMQTQIIKMNLAILQAQISISSNVTSSMLKSYAKAIKVDEED